VTDTEVVPSYGLLAAIAVTVRLLGVMSAVVVAVALIGL
jgi:hypothetical protein